MDQLQRCVVRAAPYCKECLWGSMEFGLIDRAQGKRPLPDHLEFFGRERSMGLRSGHCGAAGRLAITSAASLERDVLSFSFNPSDVHELPSSRRDSRWQLSYQLIVRMWHLVPCLRLSAMD